METDKGVKMMRLDLILSGTFANVRPVSGSGADR